MVALAAKSGLCAPFVDVVHSSGGLRYLCNLHLSPGSVRQSGVDSEAVSSLWLYHIEHLLKGAGLYAVEELLRRDIPIESHKDLRILRGLHNIPEFALAKGILALHSALVIGMNMERNLTLYIKH